MKQKRNRLFFSNFGFSTILLSFVMICVVTFSALSLITANSDYKLSKKVADKNQRYYQAQEQAYAKINMIDQVLADTYLASTTTDEYFLQVNTKISSYGTYTTVGDENILSFTETIAEDQFLSVKLRIAYPQNASDTFLEIIEWKSVYIREIPEDTFMNLIQ